jgi:hypothetical protein
MRRTLAFLSALGLAGAAAPAYSQGLVPLRPTADFFVSSLHKKKSYGAVKEVVAGRRRTYTAYLRFSLGTPLAPGHRAILRVYPIVGNTTGFIVRKASGGIWSERRATFATAPKLGTGGVSSGPLVKGQFKDLDVTRLVSGATASFGLVTTSQSPVVLGSREAATVTPQLFVQ